MSINHSRLFVLAALSFGCAGTIEGDQEPAAAVAPSDPSSAGIPAATSPATMGASNPLPSIPGATPGTTAPPGTTAVPGTTAPATCGKRDPGPTPLRRLTRVEYDNTVRDLLGETSRPSEAFPPDEEAFGFTNIAEALMVTPLLAQQYRLAAEDLAKRAVARLGTFFVCDPEKQAAGGAAGQNACGRRFIETFGKRAWRRPLTPNEIASLDKVFASGRSNGDYATGIRMVLEVLLGAPNFLYRIELGRGSTDADGLVALDSWEMASRLSFTFWNTMPDDPLFAAAATDALRTREQITAQARRMIADPRARRTVARFFDEWLELEKIAAIDKDKGVYPAFATELAHPTRPRLIALCRRSCSLEMAL